MPQAFIDFAYVKSHASFERVIAGYKLKLVGKGVQRSLLCPFHRERKPSCKIDLERNIFHCFGCGAKGNILEFVARLEGDEDDLRGAAMKIAELCGIATAAPRERTGAAPARAHRQAGARTQNTQNIKGGSRRARVARAWGQPEPAEQKPRKADKVRSGERTAPGGANSRRSGGATLNSNSARLTNPQIHGVAYKEGGGRLTKRQSDGVAEAVNPALTFELKLDPAHPYLAERGLSADVIAQFGLGYCSRGSMAGRICIPIHNERGELVAYAGRWPGDDVPDDQERYKLPKNFEKSRVLFNLHRCGDGEHIVLVEGYWSAIRLHRLGAPVAALMGWSVSPAQLALLKQRGVRFLTLLLDGDEAGRRARERVLPDLAASFFARAPLLPEGEKPDTLPERELIDIVHFAR